MPQRTVIKYKFWTKYFGLKYNFLEMESCKIKWIQKLHTMGILSGSFLPDEATEQLRTYCRHHENLP